MSSVQIKPTELSVPSEMMPVVRMENLSLLTPNAGASLNIDSSTAQYITFPVLSDGTLSGIDGQNVIFARGADGSTILLDASQLTLLSDQTIPVYDGTNFFQVASETPVEVRAGTNKSTDVQPIEYGETVVESNATEPSPAPEDEILPPDRKGPHKCTICSEEFPHEKQLQRHFKLHADDKPHRCEDCSASFNKLTNLVLHQATHRTTDPNCPICKKKFSRMASLKSHLMLHEIEENLICTECGDEFSTQFKLNKHVRQHLDDLSLDQSFVCKTCKLGFKKLTHLRDHSKIHYKIKASLHRRVYKKNIDRSSFCHKCYYCGKSFQKPSQLVRHNRIHTGERPFKCNVCPKAFNQKGALLIHQVKHSGERPHCCEFCPASFAQKGNLRNHIRRVHTLLTADGSVGVHKCELCSCVFRKLGTLNAHMSRAHTVINAPGLDSVANVGESSFGTRETSENTDPNNPFSHVMNELMEMSKQAEAVQNTNQTDGENIKKASIDSNDILQQALENSGLATSEQGNGKAKPGLTTITSSAATTHLVRNVGGVRYYQCMYCSKEFKKPSDLVRHIRIHTHEKPYKCDQCYRAFAVKSTLSAHSRTHSGTKEFECEHCKKLFATSGSLKVHQLLHTGAKPFTCTICEKGFRTSGHRNSHMLSHKSSKVIRKNKKVIKSDELGDIDVSDIPLQEPILITDTGFMQPMPKGNAPCLNDRTEIRERPFLCDYCPKSFKKSSHLKQHIRSHTGEKPYKCGQCQRSFISNGVLKSHLKTHTKVKEYNCSICEASFTTNGSVKRHMSIHREDRPYMCPYCQKTFKTSMNCKKHMKTHLYEVALGLASGVTLTVVPGANQGVVNKEILENISGSAEQVIENTENNQSMPAHYTAPSFPPIEENPSIDPIAVIPQHLSQEVFNSETGLIEHAEIIPQVDSINQSQGNIFTLSSSEFPDNNLTLQLESNEENILTHNLADNLVTNSSNEVSKGSLRDANNENGTKVSRKRKRMKKPYKCTYCLRVFKKSSYLKQHILLHTQERPFRCNICGKMYRSKASLATHQQTHDSSQQFSCNVCDTNFTSKRAMIRHMALHDSDNPYPCSYCPDRFRDKELYKDHLKAYHYDANDEENNVNSIENGDDSPTVCTEDASSTICKETVNDALTPSQTKYFPFLEDKEDKSEYLPKHQHACPHCPKSFKKLSDLVRHIRTHTGEKPYCCETCGKCFTVKSTLDSHTKSHLGEKNFSCHVCCSFFATKGSLKVHMRLHTGVRPFKCSHCELTFRTSGHRKSHLKSHFKSKTTNSTSRKRKARVSSVSDSVEENPDIIQPSVGTEEVMLSSETEIQIPINQEDLQLQIPNLVGQITQITTVDSSSLLSKSAIQLDPIILQQFNPNININVTLTPDQLNKLISMNNQQPTISLEPNPAGNGTYTINPLIFNQLSYQVPVQNEVHVTESVPMAVTDLNLGKNMHSEVFVQAADIMATQNVSLDSGVCDRMALDSSVEVIGRTTQYQDPSVLQNPSGNLTCLVCFKVFKTVGQLNAHAKVHKAPKYIYECEMCDKFFKKKHQFLKHVQSHKKD